VRRINGGHPRFVPVYPPFTVLLKDFGDSSSTTDFVLKIKAFSALEFNSNPKNSNPN